MSNQDEHLSQAEFTRRAIKQLRELPKKGIHSQFSGFNDAFRKYFDKDPKPAIVQLENNGEIETRETEGGVMLYLPGEAPSKDPDDTLDMIVGPDDGEPSGETILSGNAPPIVFDKKGAHETTKYALVASEGRIWLRNFREDKESLAIKSVYFSKEDIKNMDRDITEWKWDGDEKVWVVNSENIDYMLDHFLSLDYEIAMSPEVSEYAIEKLNLSIDRLDRQVNSDNHEGSGEEPQGEHELEGEGEYMESPDSKEITLEEEKKRSRGPPRRFK